MYDSLVIIAASSTIAGVLFALFIDRYNIFSNFRKKKPEASTFSQHQSLLSSTTSDYLVNHTKYDGSDAVHTSSEVKEENFGNEDTDLFRKSSKELREDLNVLQFEKKITSKSLQDIFEARKQGKIDMYEYDRLVGKYKRDLKFYNQKIEKIAAELDFSELFVLRKELDEKISDLKIKYNFHNNPIDDKMNIQQISSYDKDDKNKNKNVDTNGDKHDHSSTTTKIDSHSKNKEQLMIEKFKDDVAIAIERLDKVKLDNQSESPVIENLKSYSKSDNTIDLEMETVVLADETKKRDLFDLGIEQNKNNINENKIDSQNNIESSFSSPLSFLYKQKQNQQENAEKSSNNKQYDENTKEEYKSNDTNNIKTEIPKKLADNSPLRRIFRR